MGQSLVQGRADAKVPRRARPPLSWDHLFFVRVPRGAAEKRARDASRPESDEAKKAEEEEVVKQAVGGFDHSEEHLCVPSREEGRPLGSTQGSNPVLCSKGPLLLLS